MGDIYWQIWVFRPSNQVSVYLQDIPLDSIMFQNATFVQLKKIQKIDFVFQEVDYSRYIKVFQRQWRIYHRMRKKAFKYLRMRELGLSYSLA